MQDQHEIVASEDEDPQLPWPAQLREKFHARLAHEKLRLQHAESPSSKLVGKPQKPGLVDDVGSLASRLAAAKCATYTGLGAAAQLPWRVPSGSVLVLDMFGGFGGTILALSALGFRFVVVHMESDKRAATAAAGVFPQIVHVPDVLDTSAGKEGFHSDTHRRR